MSNTGKETDRELLVRIDERTCHIQKVVENHLKSHEKTRLAFFGAVTSGIVALCTTVVQLLRK